MDEVSLATLVKLRTPWSWNMLGVPNNVAGAPNNFMKWQNYP